MKKPELEDFGITTLDFNLIRCGRIVARIVWLLPLAGSLGGFIVTRNWVETIGWSLFSVVGIPLVLFSLIGVRLILDVRFGWRTRNLMSKVPLDLQIKRYEEASKSYRIAERDVEEIERLVQEESDPAEPVPQARGENEPREYPKRSGETEPIKPEIDRVNRRKYKYYWMSLSGEQFENDLGIVYRQLGYQVHFTPTTGDQGVDLVIRKGGRTTIVQCKRHKNPAGPAIARELYGTLVASGADEAILACTGGFTKGVKEFVRDKPIILLSTSDIAKMAEGREPDYTRQMELNRLGAQSPDSNRNIGLEQSNRKILNELVLVAPICPKFGCRNEMILRNGKNGRFWGCPRFPRCRGTRAASSNYKPLTKRRAR